MTALEQYQKISTEKSGIPVVENLLISTKEYRAILNDKESSDEQIKKKLAYLEAFCKNIIDIEIKKFLNI